MKRKSKYNFGEFQVLSLREPHPVVEIDTPAQTLAYWHAHIATSPSLQLPDKEHVVVVLLNTQLQAIGWHLVSMGSLDQSMCEPREVLRPVILGAAWGFVLIHNHPSGDPTPSHPDRAITRRIADAAEIMHLHFTDHLIIGSPKTPYFSCREAGII